MSKHKLSDELHNCAVAMSIDRGTIEIAAMKVAELETRIEALERERGWMLRVLRACWLQAMTFVEGPWYATGDMDELAFFRREVKEPGIAALREAEPPK